MKNYLLFFNEKKEFSQNRPHLNPRDFKPTKKGFSLKSGLFKNSADFSSLICSVYETRKASICFDARLDERKNRL